jgi:glycerophosphoryl diester phosphodiesterase
MISAIILIAVAATYLYMIMPRLRKPNMTSVLCDYAHRGLHNKQYPENSLGAIENAVRHGFAIEMDLQLSADGQVVVFHDEDLKRVCQDERTLRSLDYKELSKLTLASTHYTIPTFEQVLSLVDGKVPLLIELKGTTLNTSLCPPVAELLDRYDGPFCIESYNPILLRWFKKHRPQYVRGILVTNVKKEEPSAFTLGAFCLTHLLTNFISRPDFISYDVKYQNSLSIYLCTRLFHATPFMYTIKKVEDYRFCKNHKIRPIFEQFLPQPSDRPHHFPVSN